jgi:hypothetical protein
MPHRFQKGEPRPANAGRRAGTPNKSSGEIRTFARCLLEDREYRKQLRANLRNLTLDPSLIRMLYQYAYGRPPEKIEFSKTGESMETIVSFYIPEKGAIAP